MQAKFVETSHQKSLHEHEPKLSGKLGRWQGKVKFFHLPWFTQLMMAT
ncbi:hypothetical protein [Fischerella thermalis]|nr:hypothetical protein [Fischerella thermalis]MBF2061021.1 hypothetical protein [Fischerella thermalis M66_A2018_004]MBF2070792.1 hypothetical protein [Fischerella thermalis M48_A2018_028]